MAQFNPNLVLVNQRGQLTREGYELLEGIASSIAENSGLTVGELEALIAGALSGRDNRDEDARTLALLTEGRQQAPNTDWMALLAGRRRREDEILALLSSSYTARIAALQKRSADELTWRKDASGNIYYSAGNVAIGTSTPQSADFAVAGDVLIGGDVALSGTLNGRDNTVDGNKLDGIESGATRDQTGAEIKALYEAEADTNAFTDAEKTKLAGIEAGATGDQTASEILALIVTESTFTPVVYGTSSAGSATYTTQSGRYTKIGNRVWFDIEVAYSGHTGAGNMRISGLPVAAAATGHPALSVWQQGLSHTAPLAAYVRPGEQVIQMLDTGGTNNLTMDATASIGLSGSYTV